MRRDVDIPGRDRILDSLRERGVPMRADDIARELVGAHRHAALAQHIEYLLAAGNIYVALLASRPACDCRRRGGFL